MAHRLCPSCETPLPADAGYCAACGAATPTVVSGEGTTEALGTFDSAAFQRRVQKAVGAGFEVQRLLGAGGFAAVYAARDAKLKRDVAIKVLRPELLVSASILERFQREAETVARLRHPNIVPIYQVGEGEGLAWFVMPLVQGETLRAALEREGRLAVEEARRILVEAAAGLAVAHEAGVVHRDIKPENIMLEGRERRVLLMDFGIARALGGSGEAGTLTATGMVVGTPHYMSPEQSSGERDVDPRADVYALGVMGYEMLTGRRPFEGDTPQQLIIRRLLELPPAIETLRADVPADVAAAVIRALARERAERWASAEEFAQELRRSGRRPEAGERTERRVAAGGRGATPTRSVVRWVRGHQVIALGAGLSAIVLGIGVYLGVTRGESDTASWSSLQPPREMGAWRQLRPPSVASMLSDGDSVLVIDALFGGAIARFDGFTWSVMDAPRTAQLLVGGDTTWVLGYDSLWRVEGPSLAAVGVMPQTSGGIGFAGSSGGQMVFGTYSGELWRRRGAEWRREPTGSVRQVQRVWGHGGRFFAQTLVPTDSLDDWLLASQGTGWERVDPWPDRAGRTTYYEAGVTLPGDTTLIAANTCDTAGYSGSCRPLLLIQRGTGGRWTALDTRMPDALRLFGIWAGSTRDLLVWGNVVGPGDARVPAVAAVQDGALRRLAGVPAGEDVMAVASLRGAPFVLLADHSIWTRSGEQWRAVTQVPVPAVRDARAVPGVGALVVFGRGGAVALSDSGYVGHHPTGDCTRAVVRDSSTLWWLGHVRSGTEGRVGQASCRRGRTLDWGRTGEPGDCSYRSLGTPDNRRILDIGVSLRGNLLAVGERGLLAEWSGGRWTFPAVPPWTRGADLFRIEPSPAGLLVVTVGRYSEGLLIEDSTRGWLTLRDGFATSGARLPQQYARLANGENAYLEPGGFGVVLDTLRAGGVQSDARYLGANPGALLLRALADGRLVVALGVRDDPMVERSLLVAAPPHDSAHAVRVPLPIRTKPAFLVDDGRSLFVIGTEGRVLSVPLDSLPLAPTRAASR